MSIRVGRLRVDYAGSMSLLALLLRARYVSVDGVAVVRGTKRLVLSGPVGR